MANFDLDKYETVEERIARFYSDHPDGRIVTDNLTTDDDRLRSQWVVYASVYFDREDQADGLARATGLAFEIDGGSGANKMAALENAETSAIGRALANAGYSGARRTSREEMAKAQRGADAAPPAEWRAQIAAASTFDELVGIHEIAARDGWAIPEVMAALSARKREVPGVPNAR